MVKGVEETLKTKYGMIDIGSNTMRLVIYEHNQGLRFKEIENIKIVARLRNYLNKENVLTEEGISVLLNTLQSFESITKHHDLNHVKCVATATVRQAKNVEEIKKRVALETDFHMNVITEFEEAYYGFLAVINSTEITEGITIDIGGGSTEVTYFQNRKLVEFHSFPFGALSLKLNFVQGDVPTVAEYEEMKNYLYSQLEEIPWLRSRGLPIIAIGGSARNAAQLHQSFISYPLGGLHQYEMKPEDITYVSQKLCPLSYEQLQGMDGLSKDRADTILPAIEVFRQICEYSDAPLFMLSRKGLREGVFFDEIMRPLNIESFPHVARESFQALIYDFEIDTDHAKQVLTIAMSMLDSLKEVLQLSWEEEDWLLLKRGAYLFHFGQYIDSESSSQHTFNIIANRTIEGIRHRDRLKLAFVSSYKGKGVFRQYMEPYGRWFTKDEQRKLRFLGALLKFSYSLNATKRNIVEEIKVKEDNNNTVELHISCRDDYRAEEYQAEKQKKHLEKVIKKNLKLEFVNKIEV
ncbi:Ppx/GppA family phosphatase [Priestia endophytica]|jgi:exopolyphosphatase/guanosine-5'-triphosphate,3'-diphosphate pyrophosphatase|uniref:Ppx/GppA family phosphatase n=1 Tax=Priestia endophytica TaxID=135735 RepID=UPI000DCA6544|nr:Ppx/GppA family phosphatase [Priestia endophytica]RAS74041.1 exopolyphosphatase [Priestia endophytica]